MGDEESTTIWDGGTSSVAVLAEISLISPQKLFIFIIKKRIYRIKVSKKTIISFWRKFTGYKHSVHLLGASRDVLWCRVLLPCQKGKQRGKRSHQGMWHFKKRFVEGWWLSDSNTSTSNPPHTFRSIRTTRPCEQPVIMFWPTSQLFHPGNYYLLLWKKKIWKGQSIPNVFELLCCKTKTGWCLWKQKQ